MDSRQAASISEHASAANSSSNVASVSADAVVRRASGLHKGSRVGWSAGASPALFVFRDDDATYPRDDSDEMLAAAAAVPEAFGT